MTNTKSRSFSPQKETIIHLGNVFVKEEGMMADFALIKAFKGDKHGNLIFHQSGRNFNPVMAKAAHICIAEVDEIHESLDPDSIHLPGIYVSKVIKSSNILIQKVQRRPLSSVRERIARRVGLEFSRGSYVNLGIGIAEHSVCYNTKGAFIHSENGVLGVGPIDFSDLSESDLVNAGKENITIVPGASFFDSNTSFEMIRGGKFDLVVLGAFQVSQFGDLASWIVPGERVVGMGLNHRYKFVLSF